MRHSNLGQAHRVLPKETTCGHGRSHRRRSGCHPHPAAARVFGLVAGLVGLVSGAVLAGCVGAGSEADLTPLRLESSSPAHAARGVSPTGSLRLRFSEPLSPQSGLSPYGAVLIRGIPTAGLLSDIQNPPATRAELVECERLLESDRVLVLRPKNALLSEQTYSLVATRNLRDRAGNPLALAPRVASFDTAVAPVRLIVPQGMAPPNLAELVLEYAQAPSEAPTPGLVMVQRSDGTPVPVHPSEPRSDPRLLGLRLLGRLLPSETYEVIVITDGTRVAIPFTVAAEPDLEPPRFLRWDLAAGPAGTEVQVQWSEPCWARLWTGTSQERLLPAPAGAFAADHRLVLESVGAREFFLRVEARDAAGWITWHPGLADAPLPVAIRPWIRVEIDEVIADAQHDWSDQRCDCGPGPGCGVPFDGRPGCDEAVGPADEWVELVNRSGRTLDLAVGPVPWRLRVVDRTPEKVDLIEGEATLWFEPPGTFHSWPDGRRLVVATPGNNNNDARFELVDPWGRLVDAVALGKDDVPDGASSGAEDEAVARGPDGRWCRAAATPGAPTSTCTP